MRLEILELNTLESQKENQLSNMKKQSLKQRILDYYRRRQGTFISGGEIERLVASNTTYKPSNVSRRLRELHEDSLLERKEVKGTVFYQYVPQQKPKSTFTYNPTSGKMEEEITMTNV